MIERIQLKCINYEFKYLDLDIYVIGGEIGFGRGLWNDSGWKYNLLSKKWTKLDKYLMLKYFITMIFYK